MKFGTKAIHAGQEADPSTGAIMTPIFQTSTYKQASPGDFKGYEYSRTGNPTRNALEQNLAALENGNFGLCFGSGLAAIDAIIKLLKPGDEVISTNDLYGGTYRIFNTIFEPFGIKFHFVGMDDANKIESLINKNTKMLWAETPTNPMLNIIDIEKLGNISKKHNLTFVVDNTFATPYLQRPLDMGADIVMHSLTKYMAGHSDVVMGAAICKDVKLSEKLYAIQNSCGAVPGPQDSFLVLRGIKKLHWLFVKSFIGPFIGTFFISLFLLLMQTIWKYLEDLVGKGLEISVILEFIFYFAIHLIPMALPLAILLSSIMVFGNLAERYELVAIKSAGVSLLKAMRPMFIISFLMAVGAFYTANNLIPKANLSWGALLYDVTQKKPAMNIIANVFFKDIEGYRPVRWSGGLRRVTQCQV